MVARVREHHKLAALSRVSRVQGRPGDRYEVVFVDHRGRPLVALTEWYRLRKERGAAGTRATYLSVLLPVFTYLSEHEQRWNDPPDRVRAALIAFHRERLHCQVTRDLRLDGVEIAPTRDTPVSDSTLRVLRAALHDLYEVLRDPDVGLYPYPNPLTSAVLLHLKRLHLQAVDNAGAPDHAGIRGESRAASRRQPTAFLRQAQARHWTPDPRRAMADVCAGMHAILDAIDDDPEVALRDKAVLLLLRHTGARVGEILGMTVGGYRHEGVAGRARITDKGAHGRLVKTIDFAAARPVQHALARYLREERARHDPRGRALLAEVADDEPLFLTARGTAYRYKAFYWHWRRRYLPLRARCPVAFGPHDVRHLFVTEYLSRLRAHCGTDHERYRREQEAFSASIMGWRSPLTVAVYDHSRDAVEALQLLAGLQRDLTARRHAPPPGTPSAVPALSPPPPPEDHRGLDTETRDWLDGLAHQHRQADWQAAGSGTHD